MGFVRKLVTKVRAGRSVYRRTIRGHKEQHQKAQRAKTNDERLEVFGEEGGLQVGAGREEAGGRPPRVLRGQADVARGLQGPGTPGRKHSWGLRLRPSRLG